ncbi:MAG: phosphoadenylyl-sulfate reductase [bacterium]|nr:phosphoadenylyl-sulfate reductase [bacterium]
MMKVKIDLDAVNTQLETYSPQDIIRWGFETFGPGLAMLSSMQETASVLTHMLYTEGLCSVEIIFIDTGYHFPETLELRDRMIAEYGVNLKTYAPEKSPEEQFREFGRELYLKDPDYKMCCKLRKEIPFLKAVQPFDAVLSGLMRSEGGARKHIPIMAEDPRNDGYKLHPLANWTRQDVDAYIHKHNVLVHPLHAQGFPSIGCYTCTTCVQPGEDERAGRWRHIREQNPDVGTKLYCGINFSDTAREK